VKRSNPCGLRMILPLIFLVTLMSGCTADSDCKFDHSAGAASAIPQGLGVNIHFTNPQPGEIKMIADAGFRWVRMDFKWDTTERERGRYDFADYDRLMKALDEYHIRALFILDYGNPLYDNGNPPRTAAARQVFARWASTAAKHFSNRGIMWEIYNEPNNSMFWRPQPKISEYVELALTVGRAFRTEVPNEQLVGPGVSQIDLSFLDACFKAGLLDYWSSGVSVHPYRQTDPETAALEYCALRKLIQRYRTRSGSDGVGSPNPNLPDKEIPIISGEWGYSSAWRGMTEEKQAERLSRELLTNAANGIPISIWYDWRDDGSDPSEPEHHFGLVRNAYQAGRDQVYEPKPAYLAAKTFSDYFNGYVYEQRLAVGRDDDYVLVFSKSGGRRFAAWTTSAIAHRIDIPMDRGEFRVIRHTGESAGSVSANPTGISIEVSTQPVYFGHSN
jgi:polysaccharide biosynthesis protein PslG